MEVKPGYKLTAVGVIPEEWKVSALSDVADIIDPQPDHRTPPEVARGEPYIGISDFTDDNSVDWNSSRKIVSAAVDKQAARFQLRRGDIIFGKIGTIGCPKFLPITFSRYVLSANILLIQPKIEPRFLMAWLESVAVQKTINRDLHSTSQAAFGIHKMRGLLIPQPPPPEQRAIAAALSDVDALLGALERLIAKKHNIKQAAMQQLLTGRTRLPGFRGEWVVKRLGEIADVKTGPFGSSLHESDYVRDGTPIITVEHLGEFGVEHFNLPMVSNVDYHRLRTYMLEIGDIVFSRVGSVDRNALIRPAEEGWLFSGRLLRVRPNRQEAVASYLSHQFHSETFIASVREVAVGQTMASLNTQILKGVPVILPPLPEQIAIAAVLTDLDTELKALKQRLTKTRALKQGIMEELLTGKTRLASPELIHA
jgi:type I restriction enzyme, S subunit